MARRYRRRPDWIGLQFNRAFGVPSPQVAKPPPQISSDERSCTGSNRRIKRVNEVGLQPKLLAPGQRTHQGSHRSQADVSEIFWFGVFGISRLNSM
jgi:hypothetical protein